jgi:N-acetylglucosaminyldiphosphoundecaprenol N-acetyl-beta-D-mannosaminyltransferase
MHVMNQRRVTIFEVPIDDIPVEELVKFIVDSCVHHKKAIVTYVNVHALNLAYQTARFRQFLNEADLVFCDGYGVKWGGRLLGHNIQYRYTPPDWIGLLSASIQETGITMYLLGAKPGIAQKAASRLMERHPGLQVVGWHHGYFDKSLASPENLAVIENINEAKPNILILGFGMPLQEFWLMENWPYIEANVAIPAGAMFDYVAEATPRGPRWMIDNGLEWLARLLIEPVRLWRRYIIGNPLFFLRLFKQRIRNQR